MYLVEFINLKLVCGKSVRHIDSLNVLGLQPLGDDQYVHPTKESEQDKDGGEKLEQEVKLVTEMDAV
jgi:hypothetical protein